MAAMCISCEKNQTEIDDTPPSKQYGLWLSFIDAEGNDLVEGIESVEPESSINNASVAPDQYTLVSSPDLNELWPWEGSIPQLMGMIPVDPWGRDPYPSLILTPSTNGYRHLFVQTTSAPWYEGFLEKITYTLTCPYIFGDDLPHKIVTYWKEVNSYYSVCDRIVIDGREITGITYSDKERISFATIVLDR